MDCPDWTPEQRTAVALVETLRIKRDEEEQARAARLYARHFSTLTAAPALPPVDHPLDRAAVSTLSTATCSGQVTPSPADTAARGAYSEDRA